MEFFFNCTYSILTIKTQSNIRVTVHTRGTNEEHGDEDILKIAVFKCRQGRAGQGKADTDRNTGE